MIAINLVVMCLAWLTCTFNYFLITFQLKYFQGSIGVNMAVSGGSEMAGYIISGWAIGKIGVKRTLLISFALSTIGGALILTSNS